MRIRKSALQYIRSVQNEDRGFEYDFEVLQYLSRPPFGGHSHILNEIFQESAQCYDKRERWNHVRCSWATHAALLQHEKLFEKEYRMDFASWEQLLRILFPLLRRRTTMSRSLSPITVEMIAATGMRFLAGGGSKNDIRHIFGMSTTECHKCVHCFMNAVLICPLLKIQMPRTQEEWEMIRTGFLKKSSRKLLPGTVGAVDGFFQPTKAPSVANVRAYYSGHYESFGLNCQGACDSDLRFLFFGVVAAGSTNDSVAYAMAQNLKHTVENLPMGLYFVGDAAYSLSERLLVPFTGSQRSNMDNDTFNFHLSQMRIRIEMAFGLMVSKFRILKKKLEGDDIRTNAKTIMACARLHNYIINRNLLQQKEVDCTGQTTIENIDPNNLGYASMTGTPLGMVYRPVIPDEEIFEEVQGVSITRDAIVQIIKDRQERRPEGNLIRNGRQQEVVQIPIHETNAETQEREVVRYDALEVEFFHPQ